MGSPPTLPPASKRPDIPRTKVDAAIREEARTITQE
jgi:hypothetical protein